MFRLGCLFEHSRKILQKKARWVLDLELFLAKLAFDAKEMLLKVFRRESLKFKYWRESFILIRFKEGQVVHHEE